jgi:hypothetical protein
MAATLVADGRRRRQEASSRRLPPESMMLRVMIAASYIKVLELQYDDDSRDGLPVMC